MAGSKARDKKINHLSYLASMAKSDSKSDEREHKIYMFIAEKLGIGPGTAKRVYDNPEKINLKNPRFLDERKQVLIDVLSIMVADRKIDETEKDLCRRFSQFMGFNEQLVDKTADSLLKYAKGKITQQEIEKIIDNF